MTPEPRFIQVHTLHGYAAALLNRDDAGLAKRLPLGGSMRTRISSQCLKRHWRTADDAFALSRLEVPMALRSRATLEHIRDRIQARGIPADLALAAVEALRDGGLVDRKDKQRRGEEALKTGQAVLMGEKEIDYLVELCAGLAAAAGSAAAEGAAAEQSAEDRAAELRTKVEARLKAEKDNLRALKHGSGLESALFGRMVTSDVLASRDASIYVAHAFTVHEGQVENDYFTVVDDLRQEAGELGSAGIFDTELASGLYYGYVVVDTRQLVANLEGLRPSECFAEDTPPERRALAGRVVRHLLHLIATVSPGAKRGATAPFGWASLMLVEAGDWQPRSLAGAFHQALAPGDPDGRSLRERAAARLAGEIAAMDRAYGAPLNRAVMSLDPVDIPGAEALGLAALAERTAALIEQGRC